METLLALKLEYLVEFELCNWVSIISWKKSWKKFSAFVFRSLAYKSLQPQILGDEDVIFLILQRTMAIYLFYYVYLGRKSEARKNSFWQVALRRAWAAAEKRELYLASNALSFFLLLVIGGDFWTLDKWQYLTGVSCYNLFIQNFWQTIVRNSLR